MLSRYACVLAAYLTKPLISSFLPLWKSMVRNILEAFPPCVIITSGLIPWRAMLFKAFVIMIEIMVMRNMISQEPVVLSQVLYCVDLYVHLYIISLRPYNTL